MSEQDQMKQLWDLGVWRGDGVREVSHALWESGMNFREISRALGVPGLVIPGYVKQWDHAVDIPRPEPDAGPDWEEEALGQRCYDLRQAGCRWDDIGGSVFPDMLSLAARGMFARDAAKDWANARGKPWPVPRA